MNLTNKTINTRTKIALNLKKWLKETEVHKFGLALKVLIIIPFNYRVFQLTNSIGITEYFQNSIFDIALFAVVIVCKHGVFCWVCEYWGEPLNRINIYHPLHIE